MSFLKNVDWKFVGLKAAYYALWVPRGLLMLGSFVGWAIGEVTELGLEKMEPWHDRLK
jgi:hypothetical protein